MSTLDHDSARHLFAPDDHGLDDRIARHAALGLGQPGHAPHHAFDQFAAELAHGAARLTSSHSVPYAMVNLVGSAQHFIGLHNPVPDPQAPPGSGLPPVGREMPRDMGFCPHVVGRQKALVLADVRAYPRYAGNPVVDQFGILTYLGAPLIDSTGTVIGTVCVVGPEPRLWGQEGLHYIKQRAVEAGDLITRHIGP
ncbi:GAF domain-containing protein [Streptomyces sp. NPDC058391]|uniref:GAF domain-containing protein n=1 Tax=Streptomyces sp. NPDC058391 TaxID=3346476 RepID=UPI00364B640F